MQRLRKITTLTRLEKLVLLDEHRGLLSRVAKRTGKTLATVSRVYWGIVKHSPRVARAIDRELRKLSA